MHRTLGTEAKRLQDLDGMLVGFENGEVVVPINFPAILTEEDPCGVKARVALVAALVRGGVKKVWVMVTTASEAQPLLARQMLCDQFRHFHDPDTEMISVQEGDGTHIAVVMLKK